MQNKNSHVHFEALTTKLDWNDLKIKKASLVKLIGLRDRLEAFKKNRFSILFYGSLGTGKTVAATLLAKHLHREIYRVNLSHIVTKYIGETEKKSQSPFQKKLQKKIGFSFSMKPMPFLARELRSEMRMIDMQIKKFRISFNVLNHILELLSFQ